MNRRPHPRITATPGRVPWSRGELLAAFRLYCRTPFGKLHQHNPEIAALARLLGRTPSAVAMKACNFAGHIIPWSFSVERRPDPRNGTALNALYDRAFDRGLITLDKSWRVVLSPRLKVADAPDLHRRAFGELEGRELRRPHRFEPDPAALAYHRERVFQGEAGRGR